MPLVGLEGSGGAHHTLGNSGEAWWKLGLTGLARTGCLVDDITGSSGTPLGKTPIV